MKQVLELQKICLMLELNHQIFNYKDFNFQLSGMKTQ